MPKLTRKTQKIFCGNADNDQLAVFGSMVTGSPVFTNDVEQLQGNIAYGEGWDAATLEDKAPFMEESNGLHYAFSYQLAYLLQQGIAEWDAETTYYINSYVVASDGNIYKSNTDNNIGNNPISDSTNWFNIALYGANVDLSNLSSIGADKLNTSKMYLTGSISTDEQGYNQLEDMYHSTFDLSKFEVVGNPNITSDGVASGFSASDYVCSDISVASNTTKIRFAFTYKTSESQQVWLKLVGATADNNLTNFEYGIFSSLGNMYIRATINGTNNTYIYAANSYSKNWTDGDLIECEFNLSLSECIGSILNTTKSTSINVNYTYSVDELSFNRANIGGYGVVSSIDLKQFSITVYGKEVFNGNKTGLDVIKPDDYTVVGSPNITEDGNVSGFNTSNYITVPMFDVTKPNYRVDCVCNYTTGTGQNFFFGGSWSVGPYRFAIISNTNKLGLYMGSDGTSWNIANLLIGETILENNTPYKVSFVRENGTVYKVVLKNLKTNIETTEIVVSSTEDLVNNISAPLYIGASGWTPFAGLIDLNLFKIYVDGDLVYQPCLKILYTESKTGSKIVDAIYRDRVQDIYNQFGEAKYFTIDEIDKNFTLPMGEIYGMMVNKDLSNVEPSQSFIDTSIRWGMPDYSAGIEVSFPVETAKFTAPTDGLYITNLTASNKFSFLYINDVQSAIYRADATGGESFDNFIIPLSKGDVIYWDNVLTAITSAFYPLKGAK